MKLSLQIFVRVLGMVLLLGWMFLRAKSNLQPLPVSNGTGALQLLLAIIVLFTLYFATTQKARRHGHAAKVNFFFSLCSFWVLVAMSIEWIAEIHGNGWEVLVVFKISLASLLAALAFGATFVSISPRSLRAYVELFVTCTTSLSMMVGIPYLLCGGKGEDSLALWLFKIATAAAVSLLAFEAFWRRTSSESNHDATSQLAVDTVAAEDSPETPPQGLTL